MPGLSVVICTRNPRADYLDRTLDALRAQTLPVTDWELVLVDNGSRPALRERFPLSWHPNARHVYEAELGLTPARMTGIRESTGAVIVFFDDDNVPVRSYLEAVREIAGHYDYLGAWGAGRLIPEFESQPAPEVQRYLPLLALRTVPRDTWANSMNDHGSVPWGAGLCVRREVADCFVQLVGEISGYAAFLGRHGEDLFCGEDDLFSAAATRVGKGFGVFVNLEITHLISTRRLQHAYIVKLLRDKLFSASILRYVLFGNSPAPSLARAVLKAFVHWIRGGYFAMQCEWAEYQGLARAQRLIARRAPLAGALLNHV